LGGPPTPGKRRRARNPTRFDRLSKLFTRRQALATGGGNVTTRPEHLFVPLVERGAWVPKAGADIGADHLLFRLKPIVSTGQSGSFSGGARYSEGAAYQLDPDGKNLSRGFAESVSYAREDYKLRIIGIPATDGMLALFGDIAPGPGMLAAGRAYA